MFGLKYISSMAIPLALLVVYTITIRRGASFPAVARPASRPTALQSDSMVPTQTRTTESIKIQDCASSYQIFILEKWCFLRCQADVSKALKEIFRCDHITFLRELHYIQARCNGIISTDPHEIGEKVVREVTGVKQHVDNRELLSASIGERVNIRTISSLPHKRTRGMNLILRIIQTIAGTLPWALDRIDQKEGKDGKFDMSCFPNLGKGVTIYVLDTGCRDTHEDLKGRVTLEKVDRYPLPIDDHGHGTHVAGTAAGTNYGVCKLCDIVCIKTLDENNVGTVIDIVDAIEYILEQKKENPNIPAVAVMSLGGSLETDILDNAVNKLAESNVFPAVAAGNAFTNSCDWTPPRAKHAVTVGATMQDDELRFSSNYGKCITIVAPGEDIRSASHLGDSLYVSMSGTSMAAPYVAGVAALMLGEDPDLTPTQIVKMMKLKAKILDDRIHDSEYPILRILHENCHLYGFQERELYPELTPKVLGEGNLPVQTDLSSTAASPTFSESQSGSPPPSSSLPPSVSPAPTYSDFPSVSPSESTWPSLSTSSATASSPPQSASPSTSSVSSLSEPDLSFSAASRSTTPSSSSIPSNSQSTSQSPSAMPMPFTSIPKSVSSTPSPQWSPEILTTPLILQSQAVYPSPSLSSSNTFYPVASLRAPVSMAVTISPSPPKTKTPSSSPPTPVQSSSSSGSRVPLTESNKPSASPTPFRFLAENIS